MSFCSHSRKINSGGVGATEREALSAPSEPCTMHTQKEALPCGGGRSMSRMVSLPAEPHQTSPVARPSLVGLQPKAWLGARWRPLDVPGSSQGVLDGWPQSETRRPNVSDFQFPPFPPPAMVSLRCNLSSPSHLGVLEPQRFPTHMPNSQR